jgi:hypothetical protein
MCTAHCFDCHITRYSILKVAKTTFPSYFNFLLLYVQLSRKITLALFISLPCDVQICCPLFTFLDVTSLPEKLAEFLAWLFAVQLVKLQKLKTTEI